MPLSLPIRATIPECRGLGACKHQKCISQLFRLEVQDQGASTFQVWGGLPPGP